MKCSELEKMKPCRITKKSSDGTFFPGEIIWVSEDGGINSVHGGGFIYPDEGDSATWDFEAEYAKDWEVIAVDGHEFCRKRQSQKMTNLEKLGYSKSETVDEAAVGMLLERVRDDVERERFDIAFPQYVGLYKSMKKWLESEAEE